MSMITVRITGLMATTTNLRRLDQKYQDQINQSLRNTSKFCYGKMLSKVPMAFGRLSRDLDIKEESKFEFWVGMENDHVAFAEYGTGPYGAGPAKRGRKGPLPKEYSHGADHGFPNLDNIRPWAQLKGIDPGRLGFMIQERGGVKAQPFMYPALLETRTELKKSATRAVKQVTASA